MVQQIPAINCFPRAQWYEHQREDLDVEFMQCIDNALSRIRGLGCLVPSAIMRAMSTETQEILNRALELPAADKARIADELLASLDQPDESIDALWRSEVEDRIAAYKAGALKSVSLEEVLAKYR